MPPEVPIRFTTPDGIERRERDSNPYRPAWTGRLSRALGTPYASLSIGGALAGGRTLPSPVPGVRAVPRSLQGRGTRAGTRTQNLNLRRVALRPIELRGHGCRGRTRTCNPPLQRRVHRQLCYTAMAPPIGFEPTAFRSTGGCSDQTELRRRGGPGRNRTSCAFAGRLQRPCAPCATDPSAAGWRPPRCTPCSPVPPAVGVRTPMPIRFPKGWPSGAMPLGQRAAGGPVLRTGSRNRTHHRRFWRPSGHLGSFPQGPEGLDRSSRQGVPFTTLR